MLNPLRAPAAAGSACRRAAKIIATPPRIALNKHATRKITSRAATDDMQQFFQDRDRLASQQLSSLKAAAQEFMDAVLTQLRERVAAEQHGGGGGGGGGGGAGTGAGSGANGGVDAQQLRAKIEHAIEAMQEGLVERDTEVRLLVLAALAGEHILFVGPPGTAKSEVARRLSALVDGRYFERLLTRFSVPEELFGPLSMRALEEDRYVRQTRGYLPEAHVAFVDEVFKANSAILNTLLTVLNERLFDNGSARVKVPLVTLVGASNELPESEELDALYDRFLIRRRVGQVSAAGLTSLLEYYASVGMDGDEAASSGSGSGSSGAADANGSSNSTSSSSSSSTSSSGGGWRAKVGAAAADADAAAPAPARARGSGAGALQRLSLDEIAAVRAEAVKRVRVPQHVVQLVADLRAYLQEKVEPPVYVSDRRLVKAVALMQVAAYANGRTAVTEYDALLLEHVLWSDPDTAPRIADWLLAQLAADDGMKQVDYLLAGVFARACKALGGAAERAEPIAAEAAALRGLLADKLHTVLVNLEGGFPSLRDNLWLGGGEGEAVATALVPKLHKTREAVEKLLFEAATLEVALRAGADAVTLANLMPSRWAAFIRNSPMEEVKPLGTTARI